MRVVVAGAGETGRHLGAMLSRGGHDIVLIDQDADALHEAEDSLDALTVQGDVTRRSVLRRGEIEKAYGYVAVTDKGTTNLLSAALARAAGAGLTVARVDDPEFYESPGGVEMDVLGVDYVLCPARLAVTELLRMMVRSDSPLAEAFAFNAVEVALFDLEVTSPAVDRAPRSCDAGSGASLVAVVRNGQVRRPVEIPRVEPDDRLLVAGKPSAIARARRLLATPQRSQRVIVVGAGDTGVQLSRVLAADDVRVSLLDASTARCQRVAPDLPGVTVLHGDGTNVAFLRDLQIDSVHALIAVTGEDEVNLMVSLLARQLGVPHTFIEVHRPGYAELYRQLGIEGIVGTYDMLARAAAQALVPGRLARTVAIPGTGYSLVEYRLPDDSEQRWTVADIPLPADSVLLSVCRGLEAHGAEPDREIGPGDVLIIAQPTRLLDRIDAALGGKGR